MSEAIPVFPRLVIRRESWHYHYFMWIRSFWGMSTPPERTSMCPYVQTIFWFTVFAVFLSPLIITGWLVLKLFRIMYKVASRLHLDKAIDFVDKVGLEKFADRQADTGMRENPAFAMLSTALLFMVAAAGICAALGLIGYTLYEFVINMPNIPHFFVVFGRVLGAIAFFIGWMLFIVFSTVGALEYYICHFSCVIAVGIWWGLTWFFTNAAMWFAIAKVTVWCLSISIITFGIGLTIFKMSRTRMSKFLWAKIMFQWNGYGEAKRIAAERRAKEKGDKKVWKIHIYIQDKMVLDHI